MKKLTTLLFILFVSTYLFGCSNKDATINRLSKSLETTNQSCEYYLNEINELIDENTNLLVTIDELKAQLVKKQTDIKESETQNNITYIIDSSNSNSYLSMKFWTDGKFYISSSTNTWYSDYYCSKKINSDVLIISPIIDRLKLSNGHIIYVCMSSNGLIFSSTEPYLMVKNN